MAKEAKIIQFKTKEQANAEREFRHLSDHLTPNPCGRCVDKATEFCEKKCPTMVRRIIIKNVIENGKSF